MATFDIYTDPIGSQLTSTIASSENADKNDFPVFIVASENVNGLALGDLSVDDDDALVVSLEGENSVHRAVIRPPETAGVLTLTIAENAVTEGNPETTQTIRISTSFPDADAEQFTQIASGILGSGIAHTQNRLVTLQVGSPPALPNFTQTVILRFYNFDGTEQASEQLSHTFRTLGNDWQIQQGGQLFIKENRFFLPRSWVSASHLSSPSWVFDLSNFEQIGAVHNSISGGRLSGITPFGWVIGSAIYPFSATDFSEGTLDSSRRIIVTDQDGNNIAGFSNFIRGTNLTFLTGSRLIRLAEFSDDGTTLKVIRELNIQTRTRFTIFGDTLYALYNNAIQTLDIRPYRPMARNTKTTIYPVFADEGDTIDLTQYAPDAHTIIFDEGFDKPDYLSITNNQLSIASNAVTETTPVFVRLRGINYIDSHPFSFYLIIRQNAAPVWRDVDELTMRAGSSYDLNALVEIGTGLQTPPTITFRSGRTQPTGSSISNGIFTVGTVGGTAEFTATNDNGSTHFQIDILVQQTPDRANFSDTFRHRVEIAGVDVTADVIVFPRISGSLDDRRLNEYRADNVTLTLRSNDGNGFKYNDGIDDNFWETNNLNAAGFRERVNVFFESLVDGDWVSSLMFSGRVLNSNAILDETAFQMTCADLTKDLEGQLVQRFGTLTKWDALRQQSDEATYQGVYVPESSLTPMQTLSGEQAWTDRQKLTLRDVGIPPEGVPPENEAYLTAEELHTSGGFLDVQPLLNFMGQHRAEEAGFLMNEVARNQTVYNTEIDVPAQVLDDPFILNRGSVPFSVEQTRNTRLVVDKVHDTSNDRVLMLLSNPEGHIADLLVQWNVETDAYRLLHVFDRNIKTHRIERRDATNYYILTSSAISQDRSAQTLPRTSDKTGYAYDSTAEGSEIKIYHYNASTDTLSEHVAKGNARPPQLGVHYHAGFENTQYIDEFEGIVPYYRGAFKWHDNNLYYRYATDNEFGVARVNAGGTTSEMIDQARGGYWDHLNFAFDITSSGVIYFVYATSDQETSTLTIKRRTSGGTETTILSETRGGGDFNELGFDFGAFLGCYETLFHDNTLYMLCPIQKVDLGDDDQSIINPRVTEEQLTAEKSGTGERNVTNATNLNPSSLTLAPGDDIPLRIRFDNTVSGATQSDLTVYGGTIKSGTFSISNIMIDVTIRPDSQTHHKNIIIDLAEDAVDQGNEAWRVIISFDTQRSRQKSSGMALYRCDVMAASPSLTVVDKWDFATHSACNLTVHSDMIHYVESPPTLTQFKPTNPSLDDYAQQTTGSGDDKTFLYNIVPDSLGALKKVNSSGEVESLGNLRYTDRPFNVATTRCLSFDDDLHVSMGYGDLRGILKRDALASKADNAQHLIYGNKLKYIVPAFDTNRNRYAALVDLATKINATLLFSNGVICIKDRTLYRAGCDGATGTDTGDLDFENANKPFPERGYLLIDKEILGYTGISGEAFTGITRGIIGTTPTNNVDGTAIVYLDNVVETDRIKQGGFALATDTTRVFNVIRNPDNTLKISDNASIEKYGELPYTLNLGLTPHELTWQKNVSEEYLENLKDPHPLINLTLIPTNYLEVSQVIGVRWGPLVYAIQIVSIVKGLTATAIRGRAI